jgi:hypothetical protein
MAAAPRLDGLFGYLDGLFGCLDGLFGHLDGLFMCLDGLLIPVNEAKSNRIQYELYTGRHLSHTKKKKKKKKKQGCFCSSLTAI